MTTPGRPKAIIDWKEVDRWLQSDCEGKYIASKLGIAYETLVRRCPQDNNINYDEYRRQKKLEGTERLLGKAYDMALAGDKALMIFLLKNRAGYKDQPEHQEESTAGNLKFKGWNEQASSDNT